MKNPLKLSLLPFVLSFVGLMPSCIYAQEINTWLPLYRQADSLLQKFAFKEAMPLYEQATPLAEKEYGKESENYLKTRNGLGRSMSFISGKEKTEPVLLENIELCKLYAPNTPIYAQALHNAGTFYVPNNIGNNAEKSERYLQQALYLRKELLGEKHKDYAATLNNLANVYMFIGNLSEAEPLFKKSSEIWKTILGEKHQLYATSLYNLANLYIKMGNYSAAEPLFNKSSGIWKETLGEKHEQYANSLSALADLHRLMGNYSGADSLLKQSMKIIKETLGEKHYFYAYSLNNLALNYLNMGNYATSEMLYIESMKIHKETLGEKHIYYTTALNNLATLYLKVDNYSAAEPLYKQSSAILKEIYGEKQTDYIHTLHNLGALYGTMGNYSVAESFLKKSLQIMEESFSEKEYAGENNNNYYVALVALGQLYTLMGNYNYHEKAAFYYESAMKIANKNSQEKMDFYLEFANSFAQLQQQHGEYAKADSLFQKIKSLCLERVQKNFPYLSEKEKTDYFNNIIKISFENFNAFAVSRYEKTDTPDFNGQIYDLQLFSKALLLQSSQRIKNRIQTSRDPVLREDYARWTTLRFALAKYQQMSKEELSNGNIKIDSLEKTANEMEKSLALRSEVFAKLTDKQLIKWQDIQAKLAKNEAAIEMVRISKFGLQKVVTDTTDYIKNPLGFKNPEGFPKYPLYGLTDTVYYAALIVKKKSKHPELVLLSNGKEMENKYINFYKNAIRYKIEDSISYRVFWGQINAKLKGIKKVYFSPDGVYNQLNLNTLLNTENKKYLQEDLLIHQLTNTKDILAFSGGKKQSFKMFDAVLFGRPAYDMDSLSYMAALSFEKSQNQNYAMREIKDLKQGGISDLIGTQKEVVIIDSLLNANYLQSTKYLLAQSTENKVKSVQSPRVLHIATHGFFMSDSTQKNPMLHSGVLLAGVSNYARYETKPDTDDGILTAFEAQNLALDSTDLVVLSACETGLGDIRNGEGVYGLQRAFVVAGAKSVLMSLWKVDDQVTQELMTAFYAEYIKTKNKRRSFEQAQLQIRAKFPEPYYWGAFVLVGE